MHSCFVILTLLIAIVSYVHSIDITNCGIKTVTDSDRYSMINPLVKLVEFKKQILAKGNILFTSGERIDGDRLILTLMDETQFTRDEDVEAFLEYPASGVSGDILTYVQIYCDLSSTEAEVYFAGEGGIGRKQANVLLTSNHTSNFGYQIYLYGY